MSPFTSLKRLSSKGLSSHSSKSTYTYDSLTIQGHPSPMDITYTVAFSPSKLDSPPTFEKSSAMGNYAEMLDDDNMSWGTSQPAGRRRKFIL